MRMVAVAALALIVSASGAGAKDRYVPPDIVAYVSCLRKQATALDDRVSDARTIATAIVTVCRGARREFLLKVDPSSASIAPLYQPAPAADIDAGTTVVLQQRASAKQPAPRTTPAKPPAKDDRI